MIPDTAAGTTLVLTRRDVSRLLDMNDCIAAVEHAFEGSGIRVKLGAS